MKSPIAAFFEWFNSLSPSDKTDIAALVSYSMPGFSSFDALALEVAEDFEAAVKQHCDSPIREVGAALSLRSAVDFFLMRTRGNRQDWKENEQIMKSLAEQHGGGTFEKLAMEMPLRRERWIKTCSQWSTFKQAHWSDDLLQQWLGENALGHSKA